MIIKPKVRGFICTTAHPLGCKQNVLSQIEYVKQQSRLVNGPKKVLVIGASTGYGLASRIVPSFGGGAATIGVFFEKPASDKRTASAGWYNSVAFEECAHAAGLYAKSINGDAFSDAIKQETIRLIQQDWQGGVDLVIYSLASPRRTDSRTGQVYNSALKPIGAPLTSKTMDLMSGEISSITLEPATAAEIADTVAVMGGEDWREWMRALQQANCLAEGVKTIAYSYLGPQLTHPIYLNGTIGQAKKHLHQAAKELTQSLAGLQGEAYVSVNKAIITQASAAIPVVSLYASILYKVMKAKKLHEEAIQQISRLFHDRLLKPTISTDAENLIRLDDWEMRDDVQAEVARIWPQVTTQNIAELSDLAGCRQAFLQLFGFEWSAVDYEAEVEAEVSFAG